MIAANLFSLCSSGKSLRIRALANFSEPIARKLAAVRSTP